MQRLMQILILSAIVLPLNAQTRIDTTMVLSSSTETKSIPVSVKSGVDYLTFGVEGEISTGSVTVKIYDPNGKKQSGFQLKTSGATGGSKGKSKEKSKGGKASGTTIQTDEDGGSSTISISSAAGATAISSSSGSNKNSNSNTNSNTSTISVGSGDNKTEVVAGTSGTNSQYAYTTSTFEKGAKGVLEEVMSNPAPGTWRVEIVTENVSGEVQLKIKQK